MPLTKEIIDQMLANQQSAPKITPQPFQNFAPLSMASSYAPDKAQNTALVDSIGQSEQAQHAQFMTAIANQKQADIVARQRSIVNHLRSQLDGKGDQGASKQKKQKTPPQPKGPPPTEDQKIASQNATQHFQSTLPPNVAALASKYGLAQR